MRVADKKAFSILVTRYLSGEASNEERDRLHRLRQTPEFDALFTELRRSWDLAYRSPTRNFDPNTAVKRLAAAIKEQNGSST